MSGPAIYTPRTAADAVELLDAHGGTAKAVAGGTALTLMLTQGLVAPDAIVSLRRLPGLFEITPVTVDGAEHLRIGALVTHARAARDPLVRTHAPALATAFSLVGNAQVRAAATVGGVVAEADYASDPPAALIALDAVVVAVGLDGERRIPLAGFVVGFYENALEHHEIVTAVDVPILSGRVASTYLKYTARSHEDRPCVGVAALARFAEDGTCVDLRAAVGAASDIPLRLADIEARTAADLSDPTAVEHAARAYAERIDPVSDVRGSAWYRREMVQVWVQRALRAVATPSDPDEVPA